MMDQIRLIDKDLEDELISEDDANSRGIAAINEYVNLRLVNVKTNEIMAKAEAYVVNDLEYDDSYIDFRLTFGDGSYVDMETYLEEGFEDFIDEINALLGDINSDYDLDLDPVEYK